MTSFVSPVKNGKIHPHVGSQIAKAIHAHEGGKVTITVTEWKPKRSLAQNNLYWKWVGELAEQTGFDNESLHEWMKRKFLGAVAVDVMGEIVNIPYSTTKLKVGEFADYLTQIEAFSVENGFILTHPIDYRIAIYGEER